MSILISLRYWKGLDLRNTHPIIRILWMFERETKNSKAIFRAQRLVLRRVL